MEYDVRFFKKIITVIKHNSLILSHNKAAIISVVNVSSLQSKKLLFQKTMLVIYIDWQDVVPKEFVPKEQTFNTAILKDVIDRLLRRIRCVRPSLAKSGDWFLL